MGLFSDDSPTPPQLPPPPPLPEILDVIDELSGTQTITVTGLHGKKQRVVQRLPRTPEEEALYQHAGQLMDRTIGEIKRLYETNPRQVASFGPLVQTLNALNQERTQDMQALTQIPDFKTYVQDFKDMQINLIDDAYDQSRDAMEERLAHQGLGNSTVGREERAFLEKNALQARRQAGVEAQQYGQQLLGNELAHRTNLYNLRESNRQGRLSSASTQYQLERDALNQQEMNRQQQLNEQYNLLGIASQVRHSDTAKGMQSLAPSLALSEFSTRSNSQNAQHQLEQNRLMNQYNMDLHHYNTQPPSFGQNLMQLGGFIGGTMLGGPLGGAMGSKLGGR